MNRDEFLKKLFGLYAATFNKGNGSQWLQAYEQVLKENIDYDKLYEYMLTNYAGAAAPTPAFLLKGATYKKTAEEKRKTPTWENIQADIKGITYDFALNYSFGEARSILENKGFTNVRYPELIERNYQC